MMHLFVRLCVHFLRIVGLVSDPVPAPVEGDNVIDIEPYRLAEAIDFPRKRGRK